MGSAALWLIQKNRSYLLGRAMATKDLERAQLVILQDPAVTRVFDVKSEVGVCACVCVREREKEE